MTGTNRSVVRRRMDAYVLLAGVALFGLCALVASSGKVPAAERSVFSWINDLPDGLTTAGRLAQYLGVLAVGPIVALVALVARRPRLAGRGGGAGPARRPRSSSRRSSSCPSVSSGG